MAQGTKIVRLKPIDHNISSSHLRGGCSIKLASHEAQLKGSSITSY